MKSRRKALMVIPRLLERHLDEALALAETAGYDVARLWRNRHPRIIKKGLLDAIKDEARSSGAEALIYYGDLQPSSKFTVMRETGLNVVDRVMLILEIFALHASSREALLQIEAARIKHEIPLAREFVRRSKMGEYPGFLGPGMYAADQYLRHLRRRLVKIRRELDKMRSTREGRLSSRAKSGLKQVSIVGYASAGKTSLFNLLTGEDRPVGPEYFTTLQPKHSRITWGGVEGVLAADTVGFIRDVPPEIVEAFHATLAEVKHSDAIVFVIDAAEPPSDIEEKLHAGIDTLARIGALSAPMVIAANKIDALQPPEIGERIALIEREASILPHSPPVIPISAKTGYGVDRLVRSIIKIVDGDRLEGLLEAGHMD
ncbi:GTPase HflX [Aeropyrum pernix]|nr:GTPase HflX [Aeropyrum pernix]